MREIKFRVWFQDSKMMIYPQKGRIINEKFNPSYERNFAMQYTGLKDKNSKEIYEGDVLWNCESDEDTMIGVVEYNIEENSNSGFLMRTPVKNSKDEFNCFEDFGAEFEVIGNIHENPELLEDDDE